MRYLAIILLLLIPAFAGEGRIEGKKLDMTVYFAFPPTAADITAWTNLFVKSNPMLYRATAGRLSFGRTKFTSRPSSKATADIQVQDAATGRASVVGNPDTGGGLGHPGAYVNYFKSDANEPLTHVHELGHYLFGLADEYKGEKFKKINGVWQQLKTVDEDGRDTIYFDQGTAPHDWFCTAREGNQSCLMDASTGTKDYRNEFCVSDGSEPHVVDRLEGDERYVTDQQSSYQTACWVQVQKRLGGTVPTVLPNFVGTPTDAPTFLRVEQNLYLLCLETSVTPGQLAAARLNARRIIDAAQLPEGERPGDRLGVVSYDSTGHVVFKVAEMTAANKELARQAVDSVVVSTAAPSLQTGLEFALSTMVADRPTVGDEFNTQLLTLLSTGAGTAPTEQLLTDYYDRYVTANVVALDRANLAVLENIATRTTGKVTSVDPVPGAVAREVSDDEQGSTLQFLESIGFDLIRSAEGSLPSQTVLPVDNFSEDVLLVLLAGADATLELRDPSGHVVDLNGLEVFRQDGVTFVGLESPARGNWTVRVGGAGGYELHWLALSPSLEISVEADQHIVFPKPLEMHVSVASLATIRGCSVEATVGDQVITLHDDGDARHGDRRGGDGIYSNFLTRLPENGFYTAEIRVKNVNGVYSAAGEPGAPPPSGPVGPFERVTEFDFEVSGVPAGGGVALIPPANFEQFTGDSSTTLKWDDPNGGAAATRIERRLNGDNPWTALATVPAGTHEFQDTPREAALYNYRAIAVRAGESDPSAVQIVDFRELQPSLAGNPGTGVFGDANGGGSHCFIATAAYGSPLAPQVMTLRRFRDRMLLPNAPGRAFVRLYYKYSPPAADVIARHSSLRFLARLALTPVVAVVAWPVPCALLALGAAAWWRRRRR